MHLKRISPICYSNRSESNFFPNLFIILVFHLSVLQFPKTLAQSADSATNPSLLERFWEIGCEFSGVVTRVRRSAAPTPEPNFDDPEELFQYLYPLADVKPDEDGNIEGQRSHGHGTHSLSSWLEDLMELWHTECHHRRIKRSAQRMTNPKRRPASTKGRRKSSGTFSRRSQSSGGNNSTLGVYSYGGDGDMEESEFFDGDEDAELRQVVPDELVDGPSSTTPAPAPPAAEAKEEDIFFSQYGGDIEYFFPLLSFGIPFDGEITLLGFHGFRGIFPY